MSVVSVTENRDDMYSCIDSYLLDFYVLFLLPLILYFLLSILYWFVSSYSSLL